MANRMELQNKGAGAARHSDAKRRKDGTSHAGIARTIRANKRSEADERNRHTLPERRRAFRRGKS